MFYLGFNFRCSSPLKSAKHSKTRKYIHVAWSRHPWCGHFEYLADSIGWWGTCMESFIMCCFFAVARQSNRLSIQKRVNTSVQLGHAILGVAILNA